MTSLPHKGIRELRGRQFWTRRLSNFHTDTRKKKKNYSLCPNDQNTYFKPFLNIFIFNKKKLINQRDFFN